MPSSPHSVRDEPDDVTVAARQIAAWLRDGGDVIEAPLWIQKWPSQRLVGRLFDGLLDALDERKNTAPLAREEFISTLADHALVEIRCDHDAKTDTPACNCAVVALGAHPTVQAAKEAWAAHVWEVLNG